MRVVTGGALRLMLRLILTFVEDHTDFLDAVEELGDEDEDVTSEGVIAPTESSLDYREFGESVTTSDVDEVGLPPWSREFLQCSDLPSERLVEQGVRLRMERLADPALDLMDR